MMITAYKDFALKRGWTIGEYHRSDSSVLRTIGSIVFLGGIITSFFYVRWYLVLFGVVMIWSIGGFLTAIFREKTQIISILLLLLSFVILMF